MDVFKDPFGFESHHLFSNRREMCFAPLILVRRCPAKTLFIVLETVAPGDLPSNRFPQETLDPHKGPKVLWCVCVCVSTHRCEQCEYESELYTDGQTFSSRTEPCLHCRCSVSSGF